MKKGAIGRVIGDYDSIDTSDFPLTDMRLGETLRKSLRVGQPQTDFHGNAVAEGTGARQDVSKVKEVDIDSNGNIVNGTERVEKITEVADLLSVSGEYTVAQSTQDTFVFDLIASATGTNINQVEIDMEGIIETNPDALYWMAGIYDRPGGVEISDGFGEGDVFEDDVFGEIYRQSEKNRIGMEFEFESEEVKLLVTEKGYVEVYTPSDFDSLQFKRLIDEVIWPHAS